ncbi:hypothetical protein EPA93_20665 [Ktedonosporobacter rubrisoli]|uniref:Uncharacterized protein n=1 Tax=Ktedonosporobacter rubrisoli TaxID=2509675 RepID=A0A4P6JS15_KTERU|nr:hypothetical protein [Ktedonosporobacter rubrisoli]QBD78279.1 hypothetical protein EPA93_20665 [Ktedonosporobacter rubrisoli]
MKAVAAALVLIAGAAVVLWYGNTLNSWVLGGLIGGLAALLLSIPISLTLFSYLARRHDESLQSDVQEEEEAVSLAQVYDYPQVPSRMVRREYEVEVDMLEEDEEEYAQIEEAAYFEEQAMHGLPDPSPRRFLPARQQPRLPAVQRNSYALPVRRQSRNLPVARGKDASSRRSSSRPLSYPGFLGYEPTTPRSRSGSLRGLQQANALRLARLEAAQQYVEEDVEFEPTNFPRRSISARLRQIAEQREGRSLQRSSRYLPQPAPPMRRPRSRRTVEADPLPPRAQSSFPREDEDAANWYAQDDEPFTEQLESYPQTEPVQRVLPPTRSGQLARRSRIRGQSMNSDITTEHPTRSQQRRASYVYDDDALPEELPQQYDEPIVRRSSRYLGQQE